MHLQKVEIPWTQLARRAGEAGRSQEAIQREADAMASRGALLPDAARATDKKLARIEEQRAALEAEKAAQAAILEKWGEMVTEYESTQRRVGLIQGMIAGLQKRSDEARAMLKGAIRQASVTGGLDHSAYACADAIPKNRFIIAEMETQLGDFTAEGAAHARAMRAFGRENGIPEDHWPPAPAETLE